MGDEGELAGRCARYVMDEFVIDLFSSTIINDRDVTLVHAYIVDFVNLQED